MRKTYRKNSKIIKRFLFSYSIIITLPLLVGLISYSESARIISKDTRRTHISMLHQGMEMLDNIITEIDMITYQISVNPQIIKFSYAYDFNDKSIYYNMWETLSYIQPYSAYENTGAQYNIYFHKTDTVFNQNGAYTLSDYYKYFGYEEIEIDEFRQNYLSTYHKGDFIPSSTVRKTDITTTSSKVSNYNAITYFKSLPLMDSSIRNATIFVRIREDFVLNLLKGIDVSEDGWIYILDENSNIITGLPDNTGKNFLLDIDFKDSEGFIERNINDKTMYITYTISPHNGWKYVSAIPAHIVMAKVNSIRNLILGITVISLIIGTILLVLLSYANSKPIIELKKILLDFFNSEDDSKKDEFYFLKTSISNLILQSSSMKSDIHKQRLTLQKSVIERLLLGKSVTSSTMELVMQSGVELTAQAYTCVLISVNSIQQEYNSLQELNMGQIIHTQTGQKGYLIDIDQKTLCLLLCLNTNDEAKCKQYTEMVISWLQNQILETCKVNPIFTVGSVYYELSDVYHSFSEAKQSLDFMPIKEPSSVLWYSNIDKDTKNTFYYPIEVEQRLIHLVQYGYKEDVLALLFSLLQKNLQNSVLLHKSQELLRSEINGTIYKLNIDNSEDIVAELNNCESLVEVFKHLEIILAHLCDEANEQKKSRNIELIDEIISYLEQNYSDSNIGLSQVASKFNFSEGYISQLFKERTGEYFAAYLENIRLNRACELLAKNSYTINDVALLTGYNSPQSFRRAFKRVKGLNPTDYKA